MFAAIRKGALRKGAPFALQRAAAAFLGLLLLAAPAWIAASPCPADRIDRTAVVRQVFDGDTVALTTGEHVRLIGINTPEVGHDGEPDEPLAAAAREQLRAWLGPERRIGLRVGAEPRDRHGRLLAHIFLEDGTNVTAELLTAGLGAHIAIPPNLWGRSCYRAAEQAARSAGRGVWRTAFARRHPTATLDADVRGFRFVEGRVVRIGSSRSALWLNLEGGVALRIPRKHLRFFENRFDPAALEGRRVTARGWIYERRGEQRMTVSHPDALTVFDDD